jgi:hypothetical protein
VCVCVCVCVYASALFHSVILCAHGASFPSYACHASVNFPRCTLTYTYTHVPDIIFFWSSHLLLRWRTKEVCHAGPLVSERVSRICFFVHAFGRMPSVHSHTNASIWASLWHNVETSRFCARLWHMSQVSSFVHTCALHRSQAVFSLLHCGVLQTQAACRSPEYMRM